MGFPADRQILVAWQSVPLCVSRVAERRNPLGTADTKALLAKFPA